MWASGCGTVGRVCQHGDIQGCLDNNCNLDIKNPNAKDDFEHLPPEQLADDILQKELRIAEIMGEIKELLGKKP